MRFYGTHCSKSLIFYPIVNFDKTLLFHFWILARKLEDIFTLKLDPQNMINSRILQLKNLKNSVRLGPKAKFTTLHLFEFLDKKMKI